MLTDKVENNAPDDNILKAYIGYTDLTSKRIIGAEKESMSSKYYEMGENILQSCARETSVSTEDMAVT